MKNNKTNKNSKSSFGGLVFKIGLSKRTNKRHAPLKYDMWKYLYHNKGLRYSLATTSVAIIKKVFIEKGGMEWWKQKKENK